MSFMFCDAFSFNQPLDKWNISSVIDMKNMFYGASSFNQNLCDWYHMNHLAVVIDMFSDTNCTDEADPNFVTKKSFCSCCNATVSFQEIFSFLYGITFS